VSTGIALVIFQEALGITPGEVGILSSTLTLGVALGAMTGGRLGDRFGRRKIFIATMAVIVVSTVLILLATSFEVLFVVIALLGFGTGADLPVSIATISEASDSSKRGGRISFSHLLWKVGIIASQSLGALFGDMGAAGARVLYGHLLVVTVLTLLARLTIPESTRWQAAQAASAQSDQRLTGSDQIRTLLRRPYIIPFVALLVFYSLINLALNTNGQFGAFIFTKVAGASVSTYSTIGLITTVFGLLLVFPLIKLMDSPRRMRWFVVGTICALLGLAAPVIFGPTVVTLTVLLVLLSVFSVFAGEPFMKVWTQESFPTLLRSTAQGAIIAVARVLAAMVAAITPLRVQAGPQILFATLFVVIAIGAGVAFAVFRKQDHTAFDEEDADPAITAIREEITAR
jgi:inositol transporter-like SP family MFS transporter